MLLNWLFAEFGSMNIFENCLYYFGYEIITHIYTIGKDLNRENAFRYQNSVLNTSP